MKCCLVCVCAGLKLFGLLAYSCQCVKIQFYGEQLISSNASPQKRCVNCTSVGVCVKSFARLWIVSPTVSFFGPTLTLRLVRWTLKEKLPARNGSDIKPARFLACSLDSKNRIFGVVKKVLFTGSLDPSGSFFKK